MDLEDTRPCRRKLGMSVTQKSVWGLNCCHGAQKCRRGRVRVWAVCSKQANSFHPSPQTDKSQFSFKVIFGSILASFKLWQIPAWPLFAK